MDETRRLYYENVYLKEFDAVVVECQKTPKGWETVLDQSAFYPEGGGQPCDRGTLGNAEVLDVREKDGRLLHLLSEAVPEGAVVHGRLDWDHRFDLMQQHSGEHMVSGLVHSRYGYDNVGFHMGSDVITIDFNGMLTQEELHLIEEEINRRIWENREVEISCPSEQALASLEYRSKKELFGQVRIVTFPGTDVCACCGTHVLHTAEIGMVKLLSVMKFHDGVRVEMICGGRVYRYLDMTDSQNRQISTALSARPDLTAEAVRRLLEENQRLKGEVLHLQEEVFRCEADQHAGEGKVLIFKAEMEADALRRLTDAVAGRCGGRCAVFSENPDGTFKYAMGEREGDLSAFTRRMNETLHGRGGGKPFFVQGSVRASREEISAFFAEEGS